MTSVAEPDGQVVELVGLRVRLQRQGSGPAVLYVHDDVGLSGWPEFLALLARGADVLAPDLPGYGASERPTWARTVRDEAVLLNLLLDQLGFTGAESVSLIGMGFGGWVAAEMATMNQSRLHRLVLMGAAGVRPESGEILDQFLMRHDDYARAGFHDQAAFERVFGAEPPVEQLVAWDVNREMTSRISWRPYMYSDPLRALLPGVRTPSLIIWGDDDRIVPQECGRQYAEALPNSRLELIANCGHRVDLEQSQKLATLVAEFLA